MPKAGNRAAPQRTAPTALVSAPTLRVTIENPKALRQVPVSLLAQDLLIKCLNMAESTALYSIMTFGMACDLLCPSSQVMY